MKKPLPISASMTVILTITMMQSAHATLINDDYIGGEDHSYGDVISDEIIFEIDSIDVELTGNLLSVSINTNFAGRAGAASGATDGGEGIGYGDLFLSNSQPPVGSAADGFIDDNFYKVGATNGSYAFTLGGRWDNNDGTGSLYSLTGDGTDGYLDSFLDSGIYRNDQEIAVNTSKKTAINSRNWDIIADTNSTVGKINFLIDLTGTSLTRRDTIALHWAMTCGNNTIEGEYSVPESGVLALLALLAL